MSDDPAIPSEVKREDNGRFIVPPVSPGRPKGSRNKLGEAFIAAMHEDFEQHGPSVIEVVRAEKPDQYLKVIASILPKELNVKVSDLDELDDEQLARRYSAICQALADAGFGSGERAEAPSGPQQAQGLPTLQ